MNRYLKRFLIAFLSGFLILSLVFFVQSKKIQQANPILFSELHKKIELGLVEEVRIRGKYVTGKTTDGSVFWTYVPSQDRSLVEHLLAHDVKIGAGPAEEQMPSLLNVLVSWFPMLCLLAIWIFLIRQMQSGGGMAGRFGKSKSKKAEEPTVLFQDVAGVSEAKESLKEIVQFLKNPECFKAFGAKIPKGILLVGPPGTGKTLLARAVAGEAGVPFFTASGSDFVEMFVGVGASRVRDIFANARKQAPAIIFIDEIDAVGRNRGSGLGGGNDEREQTLNQLLVEMDGFETGQNRDAPVIVMAATNRSDVLDPALLRPGRFDRQVVVPLPDQRGRAEIFAVHLRSIQIGSDVSPDLLARATPGFSGADIANVVNEAAIFAATESLAASAAKKTQQPTLLTSSSDTQPLLLESQNAASQTSEQSAETHPSDNPVEQGGSQGSQASESEVAEETIHKASQQTSTPKDQSQDSLVHMRHFNHACEKIMMGAKRDTLMLDEKDRWLTAYHEAGHATVAYFSTVSDPIYKVTITPRGMALGMVIRLPEKEEVSITLQKIRCNLDIAMAGRAAEELKFGPECITTGASSDIEYATNTAYKMIDRWGMSSTLGLVRYGKESGSSFFGHAMHEKSISDHTAHLIEKEVRQIIDQAYANAKKILTDKQSLWVLLAETLMEVETLTGQEVDDLFQGRMTLEGLKAKQSVALQN